MRLTPASLRPRRSRGGVRKGTLRQARIAVSFSAGGILPPDGGKGARLTLQPGMS